MDVDENETEGLSTAKKVVTGAALGVAVPAAVAVAKKLIGDNGDGQGEEERDDADEPTQREAQAGQSRQQSRQKPQQRAATTRAKNRTREQLYKQATRLKIDGRSSMSKAELERAVDRAKKKAAK